VHRQNSGELHCNCTGGRCAQEPKGNHLPNTAVNIPSITEKDWSASTGRSSIGWITWGCPLFARLKTLITLREYLKDKVSDIHLIAKIEKSEALAEIDAIIAPVTADGGAPGPGG